jgi:HD-GYP domain-containing protein (c-di-GMP phosphodiesterase class II)
LLATLPFRWVAAAFMRNSSAAGAMERRVFVACKDAGAAEIRPIAEWTLDGLKPGEAAVISGLEARVAGAPEGAELVVHPVERNGEIIGAVVAGQKQGDDPHVTSVDSKLVAAAASNLSVFLENASLYDELRAMFLGTLKALTASIDAKDRYTRGHSERVAHLTRQLARAAGVDHQTADRFHIAGLVHDVGKIGVPEAVLRKAGRLTDEEFAHIRRHPEIGYTILRDIPQLADVLPGVLHHHERWDGRGYPSGLRAEQIPLVARLIALADSFDAMSSTRTYRPAMQRERVLDEIRRGAGVQFDPALAEVFLTLDLSEFDAMVARHENGERAEPDAAAPIALPVPNAPPTAAEAA